MDILEYFDINNIEHLKAWEHLERQGCWPKGFSPENTEFENMGWHSVLNSRMADAYIKIMLKDK